jgi:hypothetical protein
MSSLNFDPLLMTDSERVRRIRELDKVTNEALALLQSGKADEAIALLGDARNPTEQPDRTAVAAALRKARPA